MAQLYGRSVWDGAGFTVDAVTMDHKIPTLAYVVREKVRRNIDTRGLWRQKAAETRGLPFLDSTLVRANLARQ